MVSSFTTEFAQRHPAAVAELLKGSDVLEAVAYLEGMPVATQLGVLECLDAMKLRSLLAASSHESLARLISAAEHEALINLIAQVPNHRYQDIIDASPESQVAARLALFSEATLGAMANADFLGVTKGQTVAEVLRQVSQQSFTEDLPIYVLTPARQVLGVVSPLRMLALNNQSVAVEELMEDVPTLNELTSARDALAARFWHQYTVLPVVSRSQQLLGVVRQAHLAKLVGGSPDQSTNRDLISELVYRYLIICRQLLVLLLGRGVK